MPFIARPRNEIVQQAILSLEQNTNLTRLSAGSKIRAILDACSQLAAEVYEDFDAGLAKAFITSASGGFLDLFGVLLGEPREKSVVASVDADIQNVKFYVETGTFGDINSGNNILIPRGSIISSRPNGTGATFKLTSDLLLTSSSNTGWASVEGTVPGEDFNIGSGSLIYHSFTNYTDYLNETLLVSNVYAIANGKNYESDTNYRYRLTQKVLSGEAANETAIRLAALSTPGVSDVIVIPRYRGIGTSGVVVKSITPIASDKLIDNVVSRISGKQGLGSVVYVKKQKEVGFSFKTRIWYKTRLSSDEHDAIEDAIELLIREYVNNLDLGETLYVDRLMALAYSVDTSIAGFGSTVRSLDESWIFLPSDLGTTRRSQKLIGDYVPRSQEERVIIEPSLSAPIVFDRQFGSRVSAAV